MEEGRTGNGKADLGFAVDDDVMVPEVLEDLEVLLVQRERCCGLNERQLLVDLQRTLDGHLR